MQRSHITNLTTGQRHTFGGPVRTISLSSSRGALGKAQMISLLQCRAIRRKKCDEFDGFATFCHGQTVGLVRKSL